MATITKFEDIEAWQKGRELKRVLYKHSKRRNFSKDFALCDQIRRAAMSITANIAEGFERGGNKEFIHFLSTSKGSCGEVQDHLYTAFDEQYLEKDEFDSLYSKAAEVGRLIGGFMIYLQRSEIRGTKFRPNASR